ncbi:hypothetical protein EYC84_006689 [Monilinia fructicola]|uniref:phosphomannomutase n=1 Tax=Monilinia fructicola TaxID=38448 RepID=A0A5M9K6P4_MONFR|nr:hypothetical protein EYC84_006689 [Monilinia fructicola]
MEYIFGPYLRYVNMDMENGVWLGTIMLVTDAPQPPTIHIHQSVDLSPNPRQLKPNPIYTHQRWVFYRYDIDLKMGDGPGDKWTYAITSHLGCTRYEFLVAGRFETNWRFIAHSGNDFAMNTTVNERSKLGGIGDQIYGDRLWKEVPLLKQWLAMSGKENRRSAAWTARHDEDVSHAYFHYYTSHFDQPYLREAFAQIPHILQIDDHDIFDGYGSYPEYMQNSNMFRNIGRIALTLIYLRSPELAGTLSNIWALQLFVVGPDCRSERNQRQVLAGPTYQGIFPKVATLPPSVQHCIWMISVPIIYPRLEAVESLAHTMATGKKAVNSTYNLLGKVTSSVAGVVGGKEAVATGFSHVKKAVGKSGLMGGVLNTFGDIDIADELRDMWTHESKDLERTYLIRTLQGIAHQKGIRMTFLSGDVNCCGAGLVHDPSHPSDHKTMYQIIASAVVAAPPPSYVLKMLHNNKPLYVPQNGVKTTNQVSDTKEDMMEIFQTDTKWWTPRYEKVDGKEKLCSICSLRSRRNDGSYEYKWKYAQWERWVGKIEFGRGLCGARDGGFSPPTKYGPFEMRYESEILETRFSGWIAFVIEFLIYLLEHLTAKLSTFPRTSRLHFHLHFSRCIYKLPTSKHTEPKMSDAVTASFPPLAERPVKNTICLFDVDGTLSPARLSASAEMLSLLAALRQKCAIGYVGGSDMAKQQEQLGTAEIPVTSLFDFCFAENGLTAFKSGVPLPSNSFIKWIGETQYKELVKFILHYVADLDIPVKRGTFVEFRNGMINVSPIGRNASVAERNEYEAYDKQHHVREKFIAALKEKFPGLDLTYSIGGQISFDVSSHGLG